jgi:SAM-dependent methyltransferase
MPQNHFVGAAAEFYDATSPGMFEPGLLEATADFLATQTRGGTALEFGIGTGRVALPLSERGTRVHGIDISEDIVAQLRRKPGADRISTTIGDFAEATVDGDFALVYVVYNSISNLLEQSEWVQTFRNAARHLSPGGRFVMELWVPDLRRFPPGASALPYDVSPTHVGFDTIDTATQRGVSHHFFLGRSQFARFDSPFRYAWPAELDLMGELAGMTLCERWGDWDRTPFTSDSTKHVSVWETPQ